MDENHPLIELMKRYVIDFQVIKSANEDLSNTQFHKQHGLCIDVPESWPLWQAVYDAVDMGVQQNFSNFVVVYSSTKIYDQISRTLETLESEHAVKVEYFSWYELAVAMNMARDDIRDFNRLKAKLASADVVFFLDASTALNEVQELIRGTCIGCLISIG